MNEAREAGITSSGATFVPLSQLRDTQNRPVVAGKWYLFRVASSGRDRMTDFEDNNHKRAVNNAKWHNGIFLVISKQYSSKGYVFRIEYPGGGKWLVGTRYDGNDVVLNNNSHTSVWMFKDQYRDSHGFPSYSIWAEQWGGSEYGDGFWMPEFAIAKAGYDSDYEWRTYNGSEQPRHGWFHLTFERHSYND